MFHSTPPANQASRRARLAGWKAGLAYRSSRPLDRSTSERSRPPRSSRNSARSRSFSSTATRCSCGRRVRSYRSWTRYGRRLATRPCSRLARISSSRSAASTFACSCGAPVRGGSGLTGPIVALGSEVVARRRLLIRGRDDVADDDEEHAPFLSQGQPEPAGQVGELVPHAAVNAREKGRSSWTASTRRTPAARSAVASTLPTRRSWWRTGSAQ